MGLNPQQSHGGMLQGRAVAAKQARACGRHAVHGARDRCRQSITCQHATERQQSDWPCNSNHAGTVAACSHSNHAVAALGGMSQAPATRPLSCSRDSCSTPTRLLAIATVARRPPQASKAWKPGIHAQASMTCDRGWQPQQSTPWVCNHGPHVEATKNASWASGRSNHMVHAVGYGANCNSRVRW
eukprot:NODE_12197_length_1239_cov_5.723921.p2 GENE.NODE_12197_length_1239_cov_5.723921~~NODE_12197_length_1239_cov_5.723921.p2  ORF type:complete len:185 (+),score=17.68 NODE_12197_length_1239_cov_5.723921:324-878(+)